MGLAGAEGKLLLISHIFYLQADQEKQKCCQIRPLFSPTTGSALITDLSDAYEISGAREMILYQKKKKNFIGGKRPARRGTTEPSYIPLLARAPVPQLLMDRHILRLTGIGRPRRSGGVAGRVMQHLTGQGERVVSGR